jgi:hypothetical protein
MKIEEHKDYVLLPSRFQNTQRLLFVFKNKGRKKISLETRQAEKSLSGGQRDHQAKH